MDIDVGEPRIVQNTRAAIALKPSKSEYGSENFQVQIRLCHAAISERGDANLPCIAKTALRGTGAVSVGIRIGIE